jgi:hypothetical protein
MSFVFDTFVAQRPFFLIESIFFLAVKWLAYGLDTDVKPPFYRNPERQRIEYLLSIIKEAEYPLIIVAMEELIEIRLKEMPPGKIGGQKKSGENRKRMSKNE